MPEQLAAQQVLVQSAAVDRQELPPPTAPPVQLSGDQLRAIFDKEATAYRDSNPS